MVCVVDVVCVVGNVFLLLVGLLVLIKDLFDVVGQVIVVGLCVLVDQLCVIVDVVVVVCLCLVGVVLFGCINMSEFVFLGLGLNLYYGMFCILVDGVCVVGGFILGGVVIVVGGMVVVVLGIDIGGLICILFVFCNLMGFKFIVCCVLMMGVVLLFMLFDFGGLFVNLVDCCVIVDVVLSGEFGNDVCDIIVVLFVGLCFGIMQDFVGVDFDNMVVVVFNCVVEWFECVGVYIVCFEFFELL